jgi:hypothetical protein
MALLRIPIFGLAAAIGVAIDPPAYAEQVELFCHQAGMNESVGLNVSIDLSAGTATE